MKKNFILLLALPLLIVSCSFKPKVIPETWDYDSSVIDNAYKLHATAQVDHKLTINVSSDESFFNDDFGKEEILVAQKMNFNSAEITFGDFVSHQINDFEFSIVDDKNVSISVKNYRTSTYYVFFNKKASLKDVVSYTSVFTYDPKEESAPVFGLEEQYHYGGEESPTLKINCTNVKVDDISKVGFSKGFGALDVDTVEQNGSQVLIKTKGVVGKDNQGIVTLQKGFFKDLDYDVNIYSDISLNLIDIDQTSFKLQGNEFNFKIHAVNDTFINSLSTKNISFDESLNKVSVADVKKVDDNNASIKLSISDNNIDQVNEALEYLNGGKFTLASALNNAQSSFTSTFVANFPSLTINPIVKNGTLTLYVNVYNNQKIDLGEQDFTLTNSNIDYVATLEKIETTSNGFAATYKSKTENMPRTYGQVDIKNNRIKTLWGEEYSLSKIFDFVNADDSALYYDNEFISKITSKAFTVDNYMKGLDLIDFTNTLPDFHLTNTLGALMSLFELTDIAPSYDKNNSNHVFKEKSDSISKVINKDIENANAYLSKMDDKDDLFYASLDKLNNFDTQYIRKMESMIARYRESFFTKFKAMINSGSIAFRLAYVDHWTTSTGYKLTLLDPNQYYVSVEGFDAEDTYHYQIPNTYLSQLKPDLETASYYSEDVDKAFVDVLSKYCADNRDEVLTSTIVSSVLKGNLIFDMVSKEDADEFNSLYEGFINEIGKPYDESVLTAFFNTLYPYRNFQSELEKDVSYFMADMKIKLAKYGSFAQMLNLYSFNDFDCDKLDKSLKNADNAIKHYSYSKDVGKDENYSYAAGGTISGMFVKLDYETSFDANGNPSISFKMYDARTNEEINNINNTSILSYEDVVDIYNRYLFLVETEETNQPTFYDYLVDIGLINIVDYNLYVQYSENENGGEKLPSYTVPILTMFNGTYNKTSSDSYKALCAKSYDKMSTSYVEGQTYQSNKDWSGKEANGKILDLASMEQKDEILGRYATYNQTEWSKLHDDHQIFKMYETGFYCFVFYRN